MKIKSDWEYRLGSEFIGIEVYIHHKQGKVRWHAGNHTFVIGWNKFIKWPNGETFWAMRNYFFIRTGKITENKREKVKEFLCFRW